MSFYKITDPNERRRMFEKLARTRKNVREQFLEDKIGQLESSETLKKIFEPITEAQKESTKEITKQLAVQPAALVLPSPTPALPSPTEDLQTFGPIASEYLQKYMSLDREIDKTFGLHNDGGTWKIGNEPVKVEENDFIIEGKKIPWNKRTVGIDRERRTKHGLLYRS